MRGFRAELGPGAALLLAALFFFLRAEELAALLLPMAAHELGHLAAILLLGLRLRGFRAELGGFWLDYDGETGTAGHLLIAAAGPAAGLLYAWAASRLGNARGSDWLCLSAGLSLLMSLLNLLPALPLDGGQILLRLAQRALGEARGESLARAVTLSTATLLCAAGLLLLLRGRGAALLLMALSLLFSGLGAPGLVKSRKIR